MRSRVSWLAMLGMVVLLFLSGCGADLRPCLHTTMGCNTCQEDDTCGEFWWTDDWMPHPAQMD
jgi:hypothetical protein